MSQHTPGPWLCETDPVHQYNRVYAGSLGIAHVWRARADREANARLIAAAPEMLEARTSQIATSPYPGRKRAR